MHVTLEMILQCFAKVISDFTYTKGYGPNTLLPGYNPFTPHLLCGVVLSPMASS